MKVKSEEVKGCATSYLTAGKEYEVIKLLSIHVAKIKNDNNRVITIRFYGCSHLSGGNWEVIE